MGRKGKSKFAKSAAKEEPSRYTRDDLNSSVQYIDYSDDNVMGRSLNSDSSQDSSQNIKGKTYGLPLHRAVLVVANAALGAGMLNFPQAYDKSGGLVNALTVQTVS